MGTTEPSKITTSPWKAFALVLAFAAAAITTIYLTTRPTESLEPRPAPEETVQEAFARLDRLRERAYETRDISLLDDFLAANSPLRERAREEIGRMRRDQVYVQISSEQQSLAVTESGDRVATLEQVVIQELRFINEEGEDVTSEGEVSERTIVWELIFEGGRWLINDSNLVSD